MKYYLAVVLSLLSASALAQNAPPPSVGMRLAECNKQAGQNLFFLGAAQETVELLQNKIAELTKPKTAAPAAPN